MTLKYSLIALLASLWIGTGASLPAKAAEKFSTDNSCSPTSINYCGRSFTWRGEQYTLYKVKCSNGAVRKVSAWEQRQKWCVGEVKRNCTNSQMKAAKLACQA